MKFERDKGTYPTFPWWDHCAIRCEGVDWRLDVVSDKEMERVYSRTEETLRAMPVQISQNKHGTGVTVWPIPAMDYAVVRI